MKILFCTGTWMYLDYRALELLIVSCVGRLASFCSHNVFEQINTLVIVSCVIDLSIRLHQHLFMREHTWIPTTHSISCLLLQGCKLIDMSISQDTRARLSICSKTWWILVYWQHTQQATHSTRYISCPNCWLAKTSAAYIKFIDRSIWAFWQLYEHIISKLSR